MRFSYFGSFGDDSGASGDSGNGFPTDSVTADPYTDYTYPSNYVEQNPTQTTGSAPDELASQAYSQVLDLYGQAVQSATWTIPGSTPSTNLNAALTQTLYPAIQTWGSTKRQWAQTYGTPGGGGPNGDYTWDRWFAEGKQYGDICADQAKVANDFSVWNSAASVVSGMAGTAGNMAAAAVKSASGAADCLSNPSSCIPAIDNAIPTWIKVVATLSYRREDRRIVPVLTVQQISEVVAPRNPVLD